MNIGVLLLVLLLIFVIVGIPSVGVWPHNYGPWPSGIGGLLLIIVLVLLLAGRF